MTDFLLHLTYSCQDASEAGLKHISQALKRLNCQILLIQESEPFVRTSRNLILWLN